MTCACLNAVHNPDPTRPPHWLAAFIWLFREDVTVQVLCNPHFHWSVAGLCTRPG